MPKISSPSSRGGILRLKLYLMVSALLPPFSFALSLSLSFDDPRLREGGFARDDAGVKGRERRREEEEATTRNYCIDPRADSRAPPTVEPILALSPSYASRFRPLSTKQS